MAEIDTSLFKEFLELEKQIKEKQDRLKKIRPLMADKMAEMDVTQVEVEDKGMFYIKISKDIQYTDMVYQKEEKINNEIMNFSEPLLAQIKEFKENKMESLIAMKEYEVESKNAKVIQLPTVAFRKVKK